MRKVFILPEGFLIEFKYRKSPFSGDYIASSYNVGDGEKELRGVFLTIPYIINEGSNYIGLNIPRDLFSQSIMLEEIEL